MRPLPCTLLLLASAPTALAQDEIEPFGPGGLTNPFFQHEFEFDSQPEWTVETVGGGNFALHLQPNTDFIRWTLPPGKAVQSVSGIMLDHETEPFGPGGTSVFLVRSSTGDFARYNTVQIAVPEPVFFDVTTPGQLTGLPLGDIVEIQLQAANTGGPFGVGAFFDDVAVTFVDTAFVNLGGGLAGASGTPLLVGNGELQPGTPFSLDLQGAAPSAPGFLVLGTSAIDLPILGGVLVPAPDVVLAGYATDGLGFASAGFTWPADAGAGAELWWQAWILDAGAPEGAAASNAVKSTSP